MIDRMPYGKYVGIPIRDLESTFIAYTLLEKDNISLELFDALKEELNNRVDLAEKRLKDKFGERG